MICRVQMRHAMKTSVSSVILLTLFALCAHGGEVERFIRETLAEQRARSATESSKVGKIIDDAIKGQKMPELELPKESVFTSKDKERDARYYKYDKTGKLISVEYAAKPEKNEYYAYDRQGNIIEKRMGDKVYKYAYDTGNQFGEACFREAQRGNRRRIQIRILGQGNRGKPQGEDNKICVRRVWDVGSKDVSRREH